MKKIVMIAFVAAATLSFVACNSNKEGNAGSNADSTAIETPAVDAVTEDTTALGKYEVLLNKMLPLIEKGTTDPAAAAEYASIAQEMATISQDLQKELANMTPEQQAKFTELGKKYAEAAQAALKK